MVTQLANAAIALSAQTPVLLVVPNIVLYGTTEAFISSSSHSYQNYKAQQFTHPS